LLKPNTSPVPHFGALTVPDQIEGIVVPQIEIKNNCLKVTSNPTTTRSTNASPSINESLSDSQLTNNSNPDSTSTPQFVESKLQTSVEKKNVSIKIFMNCFKYWNTNIISIAIRGNIINLHFYF